MKLFTVLLIVGFLLCWKCRRTDVLKDNKKEVYECLQRSEVKAGLLDSKHVS